MACFRANEHDVLGRCSLNRHFSLFRVKTPSENSDHIARMTTAWRHSPLLRRRLGSFACCRCFSPFQPLSCASGGDRSSPQKIFASASAFTLFHPLSTGCIGRPLADAWPPLSSLADTLSSLLLWRILCRRCHVGWLLRADALPLWLCWSSGCFVIFDEL